MEGAGRCLAVVRMMPERTTVARGREPAAIAPGCSECAKRDVESNSSWAFADTCPAHTVWNQHYL